MREGKEFTRRVLGASEHTSLCLGISSSLDVKRGRAPTVYTNFDGATSAVYMMVSNGAFPTAYAAFEQRF